MRKIQWLKKSKDEHLSAISKTVIKNVNLLRIVENWHKTCSRLHGLPHLQLTGNKKKVNSKLFRRKVGAVLPREPGRSLIAFEGQIEGPPAIISSKYRPTFQTHSLSKVSHKKQNFFIRSLLSLHFLEFTEFSPWKSHRENIRGRI